jgi:CheY-like chemotaxis protein
VQAESAGKGQGATFVVRLPLRPPARSSEGELAPAPAAAEPEPASAVPRAPDLRGLRVLVVEDEWDTRSLLRETLERCGAAVQEAGSVAAALAQIREWRPEVVVSDIGMPGEDGYELIRRLREWEAGSGRRTPAVALTAFARGADRNQALDAGYQVHLAKPVDPLRLALVVAELAGRRP